MDLGQDRPRADRRRVYLLNGARQRRDHVIRVHVGGDSLRHRSRALRAGGDLGLRLQNTVEPLPQQPYACGDAEEPYLRRLRLDGPSSLPSHRRR
jgi:hypothetical protein